MTAIRGPQKSARDVRVAADSSGVCCTALHTKCDVLHFIEPQMPMKIRCMLPDVDRTRTIVYFAVSGFTVLSSNTDDSKRSLEVGKRRLKIMF